MQNRQYRLAARPVGLAKASDWNLTTEPWPIRPTARCW